MTTHRTLSLVLALVLSAALVAPAAPVAAQELRGPGAPGQSLNALRARARRVTRVAYQRARDRHREEAIDRQTHKLPIGRNGEIDLSNVAGDISVVAGGGDEAIVEVTRRGFGATQEDAKFQLSLLEVAVDRRGPRAEIRARYKPDERNYRASADYKVTTPPDTRVRVHSVSGNVSVTRIKGEVSVETVSGDVTLDAATRVITAKSVSGDVDLTGVSTDGALAASSVSGDVIARGLKARRLALSTVSGNVALREVACDRAEIQSVSGDVEYAGALVKSGRYEARSHSGSIRFAVGGDTGFEVEAHSFSGDVRSDLPLTLQSSRDEPEGRRRHRLNRTLRGTYGDGSAIVELTTFSGDIVIAPLGGKK
jgi:hypothetical protein